MTNEPTMQAGGKGARAPVVKPFIVAALLLLSVLAFWMGVRVGLSAAGTVGERAGDAVAAEQVWTCSMHPEVRLPQPGKCPKCGMDLVPVESEPASPPGLKKTKYACSMFCVPPMDQPGKCPVCGMEMLPVEEDGGDSDGGERTLTLSDAARQLASVETALVQRRFVWTETRLVGKVEYDETRLGSITARMAGRLDRLYVDYTGVPVKKGDHLVYLYSPELLAAQEELLQAQRAVRAAGDSLNESYRQTTLDSLEAARSKLRLWGLTDEQVAKIERRGSASEHMTIYAPMGGIVIEKHAVEGQYVSTGEPIYTIADLSHVWVKLDAYESDLPWVRYGQRVQFETEAYPGEAFTGTIAFIDPVLNARTRTVKVRVNVPNENGRLKPGMFVRAVARAKVAAGGRIVDPELAGKWISPMHPEIVKEGPGSCDICGMPLVPAESLGFVSVGEGGAEAPLVIPASAPLRTGKRAVVYVADPHQVGKYDGRDVVLGPRAGDDYLVYEGLAEGERVVTRGSFKIDSAMQILSRKSMMNPGGGGGLPTHRHGDERPAVERQAPLLDPTSVPESFRERLDDALAQYLAIQVALSRDRLAEAKAGAANFARVLDQFVADDLDGSIADAWRKDFNVLGKGVAGLAAADDLAFARAAFESLSTRLISVVKRYGTSGTRRIYQYRCPMAFCNRAADWLSDRDLPANPYLGPAMYRCGERAAVLSPGPISVGADPAAKETP